MIGSKPDFIERGTVVQANLLPKRGHEQSGQRPAVVVSTTAMTAGPTVIIVPFTSAERDRPRPYELMLEPEETGLPQRSTALVHHIQVIDKRFILERRRGFVVDQAMERLDDVIRLVLFPKVA